MKKYGFIRVGAIMNQLVLGDPKANAKELSRMIKEAAAKKVSIVVTPELSLTGYTCGDLFLQNSLLEQAEIGLSMILEETKDLSIVAMIGMPLAMRHQLFNCAVVIQKGKILGVVPKTYLPNYSEFYEKRWFSSGKEALSETIELLGQVVPFSSFLLFQDEEEEQNTFAIELCEDLWAVNPPSNSHSLHGATILFNLSASNELVGKDHYRQDLVKMQSAKTITGYIYCSSGMMESSSDLVFGGSCFVYENGEKLAINKRFEQESQLITADLDVFQLTSERRKKKSYLNETVSSHEENYRIIPFMVADQNTVLERHYNPYPFVPQDPQQLKEHLEEILEIQATALSRRMLQLPKSKCVIGMSGGLDSTLAFLVLIKAFEKLGRDKKDIIGITMPGFGTTGRTYQNAIHLVEEYGATLKEISIKEACLLHMKDIGLDPEDRSVTYENIQARERTQILMDVANMVGGFVIGTGDLSELALGWCTYNGDHMSMYAVNASIPKTLVRHLVTFVIEQSRGTKKAILKDILDTPISPELLPPDQAGNILQKTESSIGPYVLHDFFLYHFLRYGSTFSKIYSLACMTFAQAFQKEEIKKWLKVFVKRFYTQQFKRNCMPDGVKVGSVSLSPRGDFRMPSDANYQSILEELETL